MSNLTYEIKLPQFEGPFDLILYFIRRDELDIQDIPIHQVTADFLAYMRKMEDLNIELASEFVLVAATLMRIKAKMLLPRKELDEDGNEIDPRNELVQKLLDYKRFKAVIEDLRVLENDRRSRAKRGHAIPEMKAISKEFALDAEMESLSLFKLLKVFQKVMKRFEDNERKVIHQVIKYPYTIRLEKNFLKEFKEQVGKDKFYFTEIFEECENRIHALFRFLALLELAQEHLFLLKIGDDVNDFWIYKK